MNFNFFPAKIQIKFGGKNTRSSFPESTIPIQNKSFQITRAMAKEFGPNNIRTNAVNPTVTLTPMAEAHWYQSL
jgi:hypothetical protein